MAIDIQQTLDYLPRVAGKKVAWGIGKLLAAKISSPIVAAAFANVSSYLQGFGVTIQVDQVVLGNTLPPVLFAGFIMLHDYLKLKKGWSWL